MITEFIIINSLRIAFCSDTGIQLLIEVHEFTDPFPGAIQAMTSTIDFFITDTGFNPAFLKLLSRESKKHIFAGSLQL